MGWASHPVGHRPLGREVPCAPPEHLSQRRPAVVAGSRDSTRKAGTVDVVAERIELEKRAGVALSAADKRAVRLEGGYPSRGAFGVDQSQHTASEVVVDPVFWRGRCLGVRGRRWMRVRRRGWRNSGRRWLLHGGVCGRIGWWRLRRGSGRWRFWSCRWRRGSCWLCLRQRLRALVCAIAREEDGGGSGGE